MYLANAIISRHNYLNRSKPTETFCSRAYYANQVKVSLSRVVSLQVVSPQKVIQGIEFHGWQVHFPLIRQDVIFISHFPRLPKINSPICFPVSNLVFCLRLQMKELSEMD